MSKSKFTAEYENLVREEICKTGCEDIVYFPQLLPALKLNGLNPKGAAIGALMYPLGYMPGRDLWWKGHELRVWIKPALARANNHELVQLLEAANWQPFEQA